ncbi:MAG: hypothetical protein R2932_03595 [Caldilineaceae bacterium]
MAIELPNWFITLHTLEGDAWEETFDQWQSALYRATTMENGRLSARRIGVNQFIYVGFTEHRATLSVTQKGRTFVPRFPYRPKKEEPSWLICPGCGVLLGSENEYIDAIGFDKQEVFQLLAEILRHGDLPTISTKPLTPQLPLPIIFESDELPPAWWQITWDAQVV